MRSHAVSKKSHIVILIAIFFVLFFCVVTPSKVYASSGWIQKDEKVGYGDKNRIDAWDTQESSWKDGGYYSGNAVSSVPEMIFANMFITLGDMNRMIATGQDPLSYYGISNELRTDSPIHMTIDEVVYGRLIQNSKSISYCQFELEPGNPYGIIASVVYVVFRQAALSLLLVIFIIDLVGNMLHGGSRGRQRLKEDLVALVVSFALLYMMPFIVDWILYLRNSLMRAIAQAFSSGGVAGLSGSLREQAATTHKVGVAALYCILSFCGLYYFINYVGTALIQTVLFGAFPVITIMRTKAKRSFQVWAGVFFPNLFIPLVDSILLMIPGVMLAISNSAVWSLEEKANMAGAGLAAAILVMTCLFAVIPSRNAILRAFGGVTGVTPRSGFGGIMGAAMMAGRMLSRVGSAKGGGGNTVVEAAAESADDIKSKAAGADETALAMNQVTDRMSKGMDDTDSLLEKFNGEVDGAFSDGDSKYIGDGSNEEAVDKVLNGGDAAATLASGGINEVIGSDISSGDGDTINEGGADVINNADTTASLNQNRLNELNATAEAEVDQEAFGSITGIDGKTMTPEMLETLENNPNALTQLNSLEGQMAMAAGMEKVNEASAAADARTDPTASKPVDTLSSTESTAQRARQVSEIAKEDAAFAGGLNHTELARYNNLKQMDNLNSLIEKNQQEAVNLQTKNQSLSSQRDAIVAKANSGVALSGTERSRVEAINGQIQMNNEQLAHYQQRDGVLRGELGKVKGRESQFAAMDKSAYGGNAATANAYADSASYRASKEVLMRKAQLANYKTFDSAQFTGSITPQRQADLYRERLEKAIVREGQVAGASGRSAYSPNRGHRSMGGSGSSGSYEQREPRGGKNGPSGVRSGNGQGSGKRTDSANAGNDSRLNDFNRNAAKGINDAKEKPTTPHPKK